MATDPGSPGGEAAREEPNPWHQLFGLSWVDFFRGTAVTVEPEKDLSHHQQLLDLVIVWPEGTDLPRQLPDGFDNLGRYNLVTFKSYREALTGYALDELVGHFVNFHKQVSPKRQAPLPLSSFRRYAVCVRVPENLMQEVELRRLQDGVYEARHFSGTMRIVVIHELPRTEANAMLLLFSAREDLIAYGAKHYRPYSQDTSTLLSSLITRYYQEGMPMPETLEQFVKRARKELLSQTSADERKEMFRGLSSEERKELLSQLPPQERKELLSQLPPQERKEWLRELPTEEVLEGRSLEEIMKGLSPEARKEMLRLLGSNESRTS